MPLSDHPVSREGSMTMRSDTRSILAGTFVLLFGLSVHSQTRKDTQRGELRGDVADTAENAPIRDAFVLVHSGSGKGDVTAKLDEQGRFRLPLTAGFYDVFVAAEGFAPSCKKVEISVGHATSFKGRLKPDVEHLQASAP
jgi:hypothetical protein